jgi:purine-binding chemotaxis protein CheW
MTVTAAPGHSPAAAPNEARAGQYLMFTLGEETFACRINSIREIIECPPMTAIPLAPDFLRGVINLRGAVVPVIDLSARFERGQTQLGERTCIVILEVEAEEGSQLLGVIVDGVTAVLEVEAGDIESRPKLGSGIRSEFIAGMIRQGELFVLMLDMARVLSGDELEQLVALQQPQQEAGATL